MGTLPGASPVSLSASTTGDTVGISLDANFIDGVFDGRRPAGEETGGVPRRELFCLGGVSTKSRQHIELGQFKMGSSSLVERRESVKPAHWRLKITFWLDVALLISVCALQTVSFTGLVLHEWLGLAMVGMVLAHLLFAWSWIATQSRSLLAAQSARSRINYFLNLTLFASVTAAIFSGILISQKAIPVLIGTKAAPDMDWRWDTLHNDFSGAVLILSAFHLAINWDWVLAALLKFFSRVREGAL